jgi:RNA polymerase sigma-70 factor (ECF subfamily)
MQEFVMRSTLPSRRVGGPAVCSTAHGLPADPTDAFEVLYRRYADPIAGFLIRRLNDRDLALELRDEVFLRVWQALPHWQDRGIDPKTWLYRIAHARLIDTYRRQRRITFSPLEETVADQLPDPSSVTDHEILSHDSARRLRHCVTRLDEDQRTVIELRWFEQLPFREIAKRTGKSEGAVKGLHHRGLVNLRDLVERGVFDAPFEQLSFLP